MITISLSRRELSLPSIPLFVLQNLEEQTNSVATSFCRFIKLMMRHSRPSGSKTQSIGTNQPTSAQCCLQQHIIKESMEKNTSQQNVSYQSLRNRFKQEGLVQKFDQRVRSHRQSISTSASESIIAQEPNTWEKSQFETEYEVGEVIGQGANAIVRKCVRRSDGAVFAVKVSQVEEEHLLYLRKLFNRLSKLHHPNIICYRVMYINLKNRTCHIVMDYIAYPTLADVIYCKESTHKPLVDAQIREVMKQLFEVLRFLHASKICHRDVKPDNIHYDRAKGRIWLIDFGVSKIMFDRNTIKTMMTNTGTCEYKAPEIYQGGKYTENIDLWAAGVVFYEMVERRLPFHKEYLSDSIQSIIDIDYEESEAWSIMGKYAKDLLHRLLKPSSKRLTADGALNTFWITQLDSRRPFLSITSSVTLTTQKAWKQNGEQLSKHPLSPMIVLQKTASKQEEGKQTIRLYQPQTPNTPGTPEWAVGELTQNEDKRFYLT